MFVRILPAIILLFFDIIVDKKHFAASAIEEGFWPEKDEEENSEVMNKDKNLIKSIAYRADSDTQQRNLDGATRLNSIESSMNELLKTVNDILKFNKYIQKELAAVKDNERELKHAIVQLNDRFETMENQLDTRRKCEALSVNESNGLHRRNINSGILDGKIRNIERATSLLAVSMIKLVDLPYEKDCEINVEGDVDSHLDACIQSRVVKLYEDYNDVLDFHVMLVGGSGPHEGRVEIIYRGRHGTVCDFWWNYRDAIVVCRMLGYEKGGHAYTGSQFGNGSGEMLMDKMECTGDERSLVACKHRGIKGYDDVGSYCNHGRDASVRCNT